MSMSVRCEGCGLEYAGARGLAGLFAAARQPGRDRPTCGCSTEIPRFHRHAQPAAGARTAPTTSRSARSCPPAATRATSSSTSRCRWCRRCGRPTAPPACGTRPATCSRSCATTACCRCPARRPGGPSSAAPATYTERVAKELTAVRLGTPVRPVQQARRRCGGARRRRSRRTTSTASSWPRTPTRRLRLLADPTAGRAGGAGRVRVLAQRDLAAHRPAPAAPCARRPRRRGTT